MISICVREPYAAFPHEDEVVRRWYALPPGIRLPLSNGDSCRVVFAGRPGSAAGPDVRDAVLHFHGQEQSSVGDIEFHVRASDWLTHHHHGDARYDNVILHVVLICDNTSPALRQNGTAIPMCSLNDLAPPGRVTNYLTPTSTWPCHQVMQQMNDQQRTRLLEQAGLLRFEQKAHTFVELLHNGYAQEPFCAYDVCLVTALAEGLGYGRDRAFFRAAGQYLLGLSNNANSVPEPLGRAFDPSWLDASRLSILRNLVKRWRTSGAWKPMREIIGTLPMQNSLPSTDEIARHSMATARDRHYYMTTDDPTPCIVVAIPCGRHAELHTLHALRAIFAGLGTTRADILICNVVLPFAAAVALIENDEKLAEQAQRLYLEHPGLSSNRITRAMYGQLQLDGEPEGACQQQGLHYIYQQTCREKRCAQCFVGKGQL